jgi:hypothetical protein
MRNLGMHVDINYPEFYLVNENSSLIHQFIYSPLFWALAAILFRILIHDVLGVI